MTTKEEISKLMKELQESRDRILQELRRQKLIGKRLITLWEKLLDE